MPDIQPAPPGQPLLQGLIPEKKIFEVNIEKGHKHNAKVVLRGEAGYSEPGIQPGDVVFVLEARPHKVFKRLASDLVMDKVGLVISALHRLVQCDGLLLACMISHSLKVLQRPAAWPWTLWGCAVLVVCWDSG